MCLTVPARVVAVEGEMLRVTSAGSTWEVLRGGVVAVPGDYVLVQGSAAVVVLGREEAEETLAVWAEVGGVGGA